MLFSVIYSVDVPSNGDVNDFAPPKLDELWDQTEGDEEYQYSYLEGRWEEGSHRKWCALLTRDQFNDFVNACGLHAEDVQTMGSIGSPGFDSGWSPAISFTSDSQDAILSAYVTPIPEVERKHGNERHWDRVRNAVLAVFG
jgi:hypothetical protein